MANSSGINIQDPATPGAVTSKDNDADCAELAEIIKKDTDKKNSNSILPNWLKKAINRLKGKKGKPATYAVGKIGSTIVKGSSQRLFRSVGGVVTRGRKYMGSFAQGILPGSAMALTGASHVPGFNYVISARPRTGHAESKIIEDLFKKGKLPNGRLVMKVTKPCCSSCDELIKKARANGADIVICK